MKIRIQPEDFDTATECARLTDGNTNIGALVTFTGLCRDDDGRLAALELEHYPGMAEAEIQAIAEQAQARWPLDGLTVIHRVGNLKPGDNIVLVVTASRHRRAAFEAAEFLMDFLKTNAPFWKKEHLSKPDSNTSDTGWVSAKDTDDTATERWNTSEKG
jgi:molybdopterin synthase catalytic subunit